MSERRNGVLVIDRDPLALRMMKEPHILIAGTTGSGKSTMLDTLLYTLTSFPVSDVLYDIIDLKTNSLTVWEEAPHCENYAYEPETALELLDDYEYTVKQRCLEARKNKKRSFDGTALYLIVDEAAELFDTVKGAKEKVKSICRLGRAANVHVVLCSQSPNRKTLSADIVLNLDGRLALRCQNAIESKQIIGCKGAENLPQYGTGLYVCPGNLNHAEEVKINLTSDEEINILLNEWRHLIELNKLRRKLKI